MTDTPTAKRNYRDIDDPNNTALVKMTDTPLKPCPWCGGNAEIIGQKFPPIGIRYNVTCRGDCGTILDCREVHIRDAALAWNTRYNPPEEVSAASWYAN